MTHTCDVTAEIFISSTMAPSHGIEASHQKGHLPVARNICLRLEGLFRLLDNDPMRNDGEVLHAIETLLANHNGSAIELLNVCEDKAQGSLPI